MYNNKIEKTIYFYLLANNLKYIPQEKDSSIANHIYGSIILANAINNEYHHVENIGIVIRMILFKTINEYYPQELKSLIKEMNTNINIYNELYNLENPNYQLTLKCINFENILENFLNKFPQENNRIYIKKIYQKAKDYGIIQFLGPDDHKNFEIFRFYYLNRFLHTKIRSGWDERHWNISSKRIEKVAEHIIGTIALSTILDEKFNFNINLNKVVTMLSLHEIGEINIGDITPFDGITKEEKEEIEHKAIIDIIGNLQNNEDMINLLYEFDERKTNEAKFAYYCDKLEADIQSKIYQDLGYHHPLTNQENNIVFKSNKVQDMIKNGATTAFDIWYEWDKPIYQEEQTFTKILKYIKNTNLKK